MITAFVFKGTRANIFMILNGLKNPDTENIKKQKSETSLITRILRARKNSHKGTVKIGESILIDLTDAWGLIRRVDQKIN